MDAGLTLRVLGGRMRLPVSWQAEATQRLWGIPVVALIVWSWAGRIGAIAVFAVATFLWAAQASRALVFDDEGFRREPLARWLPPLVPRSKVRWDSVDRFEIWNPWYNVGPGRVTLIAYWQSGERRLWFRAIQPLFAPARGEPALNGEQLCALLNEMLRSHDVMLGRPAGS